MQILTRLNGCAALAALLATAPAFASDWPHYMGPTRDLISTETGLINHLPENGPTVRWRAAVGRGYSGIVVVGSRAYTMGHDEKDKETVSCLDVATGKVVWQHTYPADLMATFHKGGPNSTPTVADGRLYSISKDGQLFCLDAGTGAVAWQAKLTEIFDMKEPATWGFACSPILHDGLLWLYANGPVALDPATGKVQWKNLEGKPGYSTPRIFVRGDSHYIVGATGDQVRVHNLTTRQLVTSVPFPAKYDVNAVSPMVLDGGNTILVGSGYDTGRTICFTFDGATLTEKWFNRDIKLMMNNPVLQNGLLFGIDGNNDKVKRTRLVCASIATGEILWHSVGLGAGSLLAADGNLYILSEFGELLIAPATDKGFLPRGRSRILEQGVCWTSPTLADGHLFVRNDAGDVACLSLRP